MKRYISSTTKLKQGSYVVDRKGNIYDIGMHVPSTTYLTRGIEHLASTDAEFLLEQGLINEKEATAIALYCYKEYLESFGKIKDENELIPLMSLTEFSNYAEMKWARKIRSLFFKLDLRNLKVINETLEKLPDFDTLNNKWYQYLKDNYCKISRYGNVVEFRISSDDFDWNNVIIDKVILKYEKGDPDKTKYNIVKESAKGYQEYFSNATLDDILENDDAVLSSEYIDRRVISGRLYYIHRK